MPLVYVPRTPDGALGKLRRGLNGSAEGRRSGSARCQGYAPARSPHLPVGDISNWQPVRHFQPA